MQMMMALILTALATTNGALDDAALRYNKLEGVAVPVAIGAMPESALRKPFIVPAWTKDIALQPAEAAALVALGEFRERRANRRKWTAAEYVAGWALENVAQSGQSTAGYPGIDPNRGEPPVVSSGAAPSTIRYQRRLGQLGSCTGALASGLAKLSAARPSDDFTQFAFRMRQRLGTAMLPPDSSCMSAS
jgi:hypothetical protein